MAHNPRAVVPPGAPPSAPPPPTNGIVTAPPTRGAVGGNRKKQKRRQKEAAKKAALVHNGHPHDPPHPLSHTPHHHADFDLSAHHHHHDYYSDDDGAEDDDDEEDDDEAYATMSPAPNGLHNRHLLPNADPDADADADAVIYTTSKRKSKKKRRSAAGQHHQYTDPASFISSAINHIPSLPNPPPPPPPPPPPMSSAAFRSVQRGAKQDRIWNTSTQEERERIKEFWLSLREDERKSLLKIEKEAVLRKMKEQQKHSCSCTVCGRKRTAIEEELEVLYDAYYEELEQYAHHKGEPGEGMLPPPRALGRRLAAHPPRMPLPLNPSNPHHRTSRVHEIIDDEEEDLSDADEDDDEEEEEEGKKHQRALPISNRTNSHQQHFISSSRPSLVP